MLSLSSKPQKSQELWRKQFQQYLLMVDRNRMIIASKRRRLPPALRRRLLNEKITAAELAVADDGVSPSRPFLDNDPMGLKRIFNEYKEEHDHV